MKMQIKLKKIFMNIFVCIAILLLFETKSNAAITREEAENAIVKVATEIVEVGRNKHILKYNNGTPRESLRKWRLEAGKLQADCGAFAGAVYKHVFGEISSPISINQIDKAFTKINLKGFDRITNVNAGNLRPGDIVCKQSDIAASKGSNRHVVIYIGDGKEAESGGGIKLDGESSMGIQKYKKRSGAVAFRLSDSSLAQLESVNTVLDWAALGIDYNSPSDGTVNGGSTKKTGFYYNGLAKRVEQMSFQTTTPKFDVLTDVADYAIGTITLGAKVELIGWTSIFEDIISDIIESVSGAPAVVTEPEPEEEQIIEQEEEQEEEDPITFPLTPDMAGQIMADYAKYIEKNRKREFKYNVAATSTPQGPKRGKTKEVCCASFCGWIKGAALRIGVFEPCARSV